LAVLLVCYIVQFPLELSVKIVVLDGHTLNPGDNPWDRIAALGELTVYDRTPVELIVERAARAEIVLTNKTPLDAATLAALPSLQFVSVLATGHNIVDSAAARRRGIVVSNVPEYSTKSVAQLVFALLLSLIHRPERHDQLIRGGEWARCGNFSFWDAPLMELSGKTVGIIGFGRIGQQVAKLAHAFGMVVLASGRNPSNIPKPFVWCPPETIFSEVDVISLHCPLTENNAGMVNRERLAMMKPSAYLVNTARGGLVNEQDLAEALNESRIAGAALDVLSVEPPLEDNPLLTAKNCLITPHIAWATREARIRLMRETMINISAFQNGDPINVVN
jgi:glycerate dehydrogenase